MAQDPGEARSDHGEPAIAFGVRAFALLALAPVMLALPIVMRVAMGINERIPAYMAPVGDVTACLGLLALLWILSWRVLVSSTGLVRDFRLCRRTLRWSDVRVFEVTTDGFLVFRSDGSKPWLLLPRAYRRPGELRASIQGHLGEPTRIECLGRQVTP